MPTGTPSLDAVIGRVRAGGVAPALYWRGAVLSYDQFNASVDAWRQRLAADGVVAGDVVAFTGDYSPGTAALMFALMQAGTILVPLTSEVAAEMEALLDMAGVGAVYVFDANSDVAALRRRDGAVPPDLIRDFRMRKRPGLVVFTSGSTGAPKGILQDIEQVMAKFVAPRKGWRTVLFLLMDHFGGFNTFVSAFAYGGMAVCPGGRDPESVARAIQDSRADLLPTTPTFLNFLITSRIYQSFDLSSVELITYGTELMSEATLEKVRDIFPAARLKQTYGLSELGVLRSDSENADSVWVKVGGKGFETKVVDGILWIRSEANMVGYLNAPNPFDDDGWMNTGDEVEIRGDYMRFIGRKTEVINSGGKKIYPIEVETALMAMPNVANATVEARPHPIMGQVVQAKISVSEPEDPKAMAERLRGLCNERLARYKVPVRFSQISGDDHHNARFKKVRHNEKSS